MSLLWVHAGRTEDDDLPFDVQRWHDEDQRDHATIGNALSQSGLRSVKEPVKAFSENPFGKACPNDGTCTAAHHVPLEGGYTAIMAHRHGRMDPFITHQCDEDKSWPIEPTKESFSHPLNNMSLLSPPEHLASAMKDYAFSDGVTDAIRQHHRECQARPRS